MPLQGYRVPPNEGWWVGRDNATLSEPSPRYEKCLKVCSSPTTTPALACVRCQCGPSALCWGSGTSIVGLRFIEELQHEVFTFSASVFEFTRILLLIMSSRLFDICFPLRQILSCFCSLFPFFSSRIRINAVVSESDKIIY